MKQCPNCGWSKPLRTGGRPRLYYVDDLEVGGSRAFPYRDTYHANSIRGSVWHAGKRLGRTFDNRRAYGAVVVTRTA